MVGQHESGSHTRLDGGVLVSRKAVLLTGATLFPPNLGSRFTNVSSCPSLGYLRTRGSKSTRRSRLVSKVTGRQAGKGRLTIALQTTAS